MEIDSNGNVKILKILGQVQESHIQLENKTIYKSYIDIWDLISWSQKPSGCKWSHQFYQIITYIWVTMRCAPTAVTHSVHVLAVTRAVVLEICSRRRFISRCQLIKEKVRITLLVWYFFSRSRAWRSSKKTTNSDLVIVLLVVVAQSSQFLVLVAMKLINL